MNFTGHLLKCVELLITNTWSPVPNPGSLVPTPWSLIPGPYSPPSPSAQTENNQTVLSLADDRFWSTGSFAGIRSVLRAGKPNSLPVPIDFGVLPEWYPVPP